MNFEREIVVSDKEFSIALGEVFDILIGQVSRDELEEFAGELIKFVELSRAPSSLLE